MSLSSRSAMIGCALVVFASGAASAAVVVSSGVVDNEATALSGRKGSVSGPFTDNPAPVGGTSGVVSQSALATAGPVLPVDNDHPSIPGTAGVVTGGATSSLAFTAAGDTLSIAASASATNSFASMDGGTYLGSAASYLRIEFSVTDSTSWTLTGSADFSPQDVTGLLRLVGPGGNHVFLTKSTVGPVSLGGTVPPGDYLMEGQTSVYEVPQSPAGDYGEVSSIQTTLTLVPAAPAADPGDTGTAVLEARGGGLPQAFTLLQNHPNPFNSATVIGFALPQAGSVELAVCNLAGQRVATLARGHRAAGTYQLQWDGRDDADRSLASGVYLYRLRAGDQPQQTRKLLLVR